MDKQTNSAMEQKMELWIKQLRESEKLSSTEDFSKRLDYVKMMGHI